MSRIIFMGTPDFAVPSLKALAKLEDTEIVAVVTQPDRPVGRGRRPSAPPIKLATQSLGLEVVQPATLRDESVVAKLRALDPTVIVVVAYGEILRREILFLPPHRCINVHASLLPLYRGAAPVTAAILQGDSETGITVMLMDEGMDTGPILSQRRVPIHPVDTTATLGRRLSGVGAELLVETLPRWLAGEIDPRPQDEEAATYAPMISKSDGELDWSRPAQELDRRCRAYQPWPGTFTYWGGKRLKVLRAFAAAEQDAEATPGTVVRLVDGIGVTTGRGVLVLQDLQLAGKRAVSADEFVRGQRGFIGSRLGRSEEDKDELREG
jgi:methionyl-tRNA formyltransferase